MQQHRSGTLLIFALVMMATVHDVPRDEARESAVFC